MHKYILFLAITLISLSSMAQKSKIPNVIKDEAISTPVGMFIDKVSNAIPAKYLMSLFENNRVHSAKFGAGFHIQISDFQKNVTLYAMPISGVGAKVTLFESNYLFPGKYRITSSKGRKGYTLNVNEARSIDYLALLKLTGTGADLGEGRLKANITPVGAKVYIYGTPHKYHQGLKLPVGNYKIKVSNAGYQALTKTVKITKNSLTTVEFTLKNIANNTPKSKLSSDKVKAPGASTLPDKVVIKVNNAQASIAQEGQLTIEPDNIGLEFSVLDEKKQKTAYQPNMTLKAGTYTVEVKIKETGEVIDSRAIIIKPSEQHKLVFPIKRTAYQLTASFKFDWNKRVRGSAKLILINENDEKYTFKKKINARSTLLEIDVNNGGYRVSVATKTGQWDLGTLDISAENSQFSFKLK